MKYEHWAIFLLMAILFMLVMIHFDLQKPRVSKVNFFTCDQPITSDLINKLEGGE